MITRTRAAVAPAWLMAGLLVLSGCGRSPTRQSGTVAVPRRLGDALLDGTAESLNELSVEDRRLQTRSRYSTGTHRLAGPRNRASRGTPCRHETAVLRRPRVEA